MVQTSGARPGTRNASGITPITVDGAPFTMIGWPTILGLAANRLRPPAALTERLHERAEALLMEVGFLQENNPSRLYDELRAIVGRADLDERETTIALGILRQIEWRVRQA